MFFFKVAKKILEKIIQIENLICNFLVLVILKSDAQVFEIKLIQCKNFTEKQENVFFKSCPKNSGKNHIDREFNLQFFGVGYFEIRCTVLEIKLIQCKNFYFNFGKNHIVFF